MSAFVCEITPLSRLSNYIRVRMCVYVCISHSPHVFIHRVVHPNILFIHRHRRDNFQGLRLVSHRLHRSHMHKNAHRKLYLKEKAKKKRKKRMNRAEWRHKTSGFNFISLFFNSFFFYYFLFQIVSLVRLPAHCGLCSLQFFLCSCDCLVARSSLLLLLLLLLLYELHFNSFSIHFSLVRDHFTHLPWTIDSLGEKCGNFFYHTSSKTQKNNQEYELNEQLVIPISSFRVATYKIHNNITHTTQ